MFPKWVKLKEEYQEITIFQETGWLESWWEYKSKIETITPYIIEIREHNKTIGIIPLYCSQEKFKNINFRILKPIGDELSDYLIPILSIKYPTDKQLGIAWKKIKKDRDSWDFIEWGDIPENSVLDSFFKRQSKWKNPLISRIRGHVCPFLELNNNAETVKLKFEQNLLNEILKKERKLEKKGDLLFSKVLAEKEIEPVMNMLFEFHCERWANTKSPSRFSNLEDRQHALDAARSLFKCNLLHLTYLSFNNEIISVEFAMKDDKKIYLYNTGYSNKYKKYSVGNIMLYKLIIDACKEGFDILDFTRGGENYKKQWGTLQKYNVKYTFFNFSLKSVFYKILYQVYKSKLLKLYINKFFEMKLLKSKLRILIITLLNVQQFFELDELLMIL